MASTAVAVKSRQANEAPLHRTSVTLSIDEKYTSSVVDKRPMHTSCVKNKLCCDDQSEACESLSDSQESGQFASIFPRRKESHSVGRPCAIARHRTSK